MSEQTLPARVDALENQLARIAAMTEQNTRAIDALIHINDQRHSTIEKRLDNIERQLSALNESNRLLAELVRSRLPAPGAGGE